MADKSKKEKFEESKDELFEKYKDDLIDFESYWEYFYKYLNPNKLKLQKDKERLVKLSFYAGADAMNSILKDMSHKKDAEPDQISFIISMLSQCIRDDLSELILENTLDNLKDILPKELAKLFNQVKSELREEVSKAQQRTVGSEKIEDGLATELLELLLNKVGVEAKVVGVGEVKVSIGSIKKGNQKVH